MITQSKINASLEDPISEVIDNSYKLNGITDGMFNNDQIDRGGRAITSEELGTTFDISQGSIQPIENIAQPPSPIQDVPVPVPNDIDAVNMNVLYNK